MDTTILAKQLGKSAFAKAKRFEVTKEDSKRDNEVFVLTNLIHQTEVFLRAKNRLNTNEVVKIYLDVVESQKLFPETEFDLRDCLYEKVETLEKTVTQTPGNTPESALLQNKIQVFTAVINAINQRYFLDCPEFQNGQTFENRVKLKWNGDKKALYQDIRELKRKNGKNGLPVLSNSYEEIAQFLRQNVEGFDNTTISTVLGALKKNDPPKKG
jgi:hypothetical protein